MNKIIDLKTILLLGVIVVLCILLMDKCHSNHVVTNEVEDYNNYKDTAMTYKAKNGDLITYNKALKLSNSTMKLMNDSLYKALENLKIKKPTSYTKIVTETKIDTVYVPFETQLPCDPFTLDFSIDSTWYKIDGRLTESDLTFNNITIPNRQDVVVGINKNGLFKKNEYIVTIQNTNPYVNVTGVQSYTITPTKKFYDKWWFKGGIGFIAGFATSQQLNK